MRSPWWSAAPDPSTRPAGRADAAYAAASDALGITPRGEPFAASPTWTAPGAWRPASGRRRTRVRRTVLSKPCTTLPPPRESGSSRATSVTSRRTRPACTAAVSRARYLAAADVLRSPIRRQLGLDRPTERRAPLGYPPALPDRPVDRHRRGPLGGTCETCASVADGTVGVAILTSRQGPSSTTIMREFPALAARLAGAQGGPARAAGHCGSAFQPAPGRAVPRRGRAAGYVDALTGEWAIALGCARTGGQCCADRRPGRLPPGSGGAYVTPLPAADIGAPDGEQLAGRAMIVPAATLTRGLQPGGQAAGPVIGAADNIVGWRCQQVIRPPCSPQRCVARMLGGRRAVAVPECRFLCIGSPARVSPTEAKRCLLTVQRSRRLGVLRIPRSDTSWIAQRATNIVAGCQRSRSTRCDPVLTTSAGGRFCK